MGELVSIIMPSYNSEDFISEAIESVLKQSYLDWELLIIDDKSTDSTQKIMTDFANKDSRISYIIKDENSGPAKSRNLGIEKAKGRYIAFLDSDDRWDTVFLEKMVKFAEEKKYSFVFSSYRQMNEELSSCFSIFHVPEKINFNGVLKSCPISALAMLYDVKALGKEYMEDISREDVSLWLKLLKKTEYAWGLDEPLADYRIRQNSRSRNKFKILLQQWGVYRDYLKLSYIKSTYLIINWAVRSFKKYFKVNFL